MTTDNGMDPDASPIGYERTILNLQRRIRLLESALALSVELIRSSTDPSALKQIEEMLSHVRPTKTSNDE